MQTNERLGTPDGVPLVCFRKKERMNSSSYKDKFAVLSAAGSGVILTRTREPHRVLQALQEHAHIKRRGFRHWNFVQGWVTPSESPSDTATPDIEPLTDPYEALRRICDLDGDGANAWDACIMAMVWPEVVIGQHAPFEECLRQYAREFPSSRRRLVLVTSEGFTMPDKLQHDIPVLDFDLPSREELRDVYTSLVSMVDTENEQPYTAKEIDSITAIGAGMTEAEFELACAKAIAMRRADWPDVPITHMVETISESKTEIVRRSEVLELMKSEDLNSIGGLEPLKEWIKRRKTVFSEDARDKGVDSPRGIVLIGPPGTGKSMCAKAIASELMLPLIKFDISRVFAGIIGQTEGRVRSALKQIEAMAPCVVFLDEVDKAGIDPRQAGGDSGVSKRVMGSILTFMQESKAPMFWILTANRPDSLPPELLRKGRMDEVFSVLPPTKTEREAIIKIHLEKRKQKMVGGKALGRLIDKSKGYVGAELEAAIKEACVDAYVNGTSVTATAILRQLECMKPISVAFKADFDRMRQWAADNARPSSIEDPDETPRRRVVKRSGRVLES